MFYYLTLYTLLYKSIKINPILKLIKVKLLKHPQLIQPVRDHAQLNGSRREPQLVVVTVIYYAVPPQIAFPFIHPSDLHDHLYGPSRSPRLVMVLTVVRTVTRFPKPCLTDPKGSSQSPFPMLDHVIP